MPNSRGGWIGGAVVVGLLMLLASWFLIVSPQLTATDDVNVQTDGIRKSNDALAVKVAALAADFAKIDDYKAELATLQVSLPTSTDRVAVADVLTELADDSGVALLVEQVDDPVSLLGQIRAVAEEKARVEKEAADKAAAGKTPASGEETAAAPAEVVRPQGWAAQTMDDLVAVPAKIEVSGDYGAVRDFLAALRAEPERYLLTSSPQISYAEGGSDADPSLSASFDLYAFVFTDTVTEIATEILDGGTEVPAAPTSNDDPFGSHSKD